MANYISLVADKLKIINEIGRINKLIDLAKQNNGEVLGFYDNIQLLRTQLEIVDSQILIYRG